MKMYGRAVEVAERIIDAFKKGPENLPKALAPIFIRRNDDVPCRKWSWHNQLLVALSGTSDARGMRQWGNVGRKVKRGSKAIWILAPCIKTVKEKNAKGEEEKKNVIYGFKGVPVFAVEDTDGKPLPGNEHYDDWVRNLPLLEVAEAWGVRVGTYSGEGSGALGYFQFGSRGHAIMLGVQNLSTWAHELVHAADERLTKIAGDRSIAEIVAELGSAILLESIGCSYDADLGGAYAYIQRFAESGGKPPVRACIDVLHRACNCVALILDTARQANADTGKDAITPVLDPENGDDEQPMLPSQNLAFHTSSYIYGQ